MTRAYISAKLKDKHEIEIVRDVVHSNIRGSHYYNKKYPHITVIPPFRIPEEREEDVVELADTCDLVGREVDIKGIAVWKNISEPYVVMLDVDVEIEDVRKELLEILEEYTEGPISDPVNPHITLFKSHGWWTDNGKKTRKDIQDQILKFRQFRSTEVKSVDAEFKDK